jgi:hypothetical protein
MTKTQLLNNFELIKNSNDLEYIKEICDICIKSQTTDEPPSLTQLEMSSEDIQKAENIGKKLGYTQLPYTSTSGLWGVFCLRDKPSDLAGCIIKTKEFGFLFIRDMEDLNLV